MKRDTKLSLVWEDDTKVWDCFLNEAHGTGLVLLASTDPRDFPGTPEEQSAKARDLAYREGLDVLRSIVKEPESPVVEAARKMRAAQRAYFKDRSSANLIESKRLETDFDRLLAALPSPVKAPADNNLRLFADD